MVAQVSVKHLTGRTQNCKSNIQSTLIELDEL